VREKTRLGRAASSLTVTDSTFSIYGSSTLYLVLGGPVSLTNAEAVELEHTVFAQDRDMRAGVTLAGSTQLSPMMRYIASTAA
jgi:hypothetical protein